MNILVTGGLGFIGSHLVPHLLKRSKKVIIVDSSTSKKPSHLPNNVTLYTNDLCDPKIENIFSQENPAKVIHLAAQTSVQKSLEQPLNDAKINILGTIKLLQYAVRYQTNKFIFASTGAVYGEPTYLPICENHPIQPKAFYGLSKYISELYIKKYFDLYGLPYSILRFSNVYGPTKAFNGEGNVITLFKERLSEDKPLTIFGDGDQTRDFIFVEDIVKACLKAMCHPSSFTINVSSNQQVSLNQLVAFIKEIVAQEIQMVYTDHKVGDIRKSCLDHRKARKILSWQPQVPIQQGLERTFLFKSVKK